MSSSNIEPEVEMLYRIHAELASKLLGLRWCRQYVWDDRAAVFEFVWGVDSRVAIDVFVGPARGLKVHVVARDESLFGSLDGALAGVPGARRPVSGRGARFEVLSDEMPGESADVKGVVARIASRIKEVRSAIEPVSPMTSTWTAGNGVVVEYVDREPRRNSRQLIVVLTSIRKDRRWLDFGGPFGDSMRSVRARLLFLFDGHDGEYCYHMRLHGSRNVEQATLEFLAHYVEMYGYSWSDVVLCGMSKGGTASIVLGSQIPGVRVVALAPQMRLGQYLATSRAPIFRHMFGVDPEADSIAAADAIVPECFGALVSAGRRVTVITAPEDENCFGYFAASTLPLRNAANLDVVVLDDESIVDHFSALKYGLPVLLGLLAIGSVGVSIGSLVGHEMAV